MYLTNPLCDENISEGEIIFYEPVFDKLSNFYSVGLYIYNFHSQDSNLAQIHCKIEKT